MKKEAQNKKLLKTFLKGHGMSIMKSYNMGITSFHRRLTDLREGLYNGFEYPINYGEWVSYDGKRFKLYHMDMEKLNEKLRKIKDKEILRKVALLA